MLNYERKDLTAETSKAVCSESFRAAEFLTIGCTAPRNRISMEVNV